MGISARRAILTAQQPINRSFAFDTLGLDNNWGYAITVTVKGTFSAPVTAKSISPRFYTSGVFKGRAVIYSDAGLVTSGPYQNVSVSANEKIVLPVTDAILSAGTVYYIGLWTGADSTSTAGLGRRGTTFFSDGATFDSSPTGVTFTKSPAGMVYTTSDTKPTISTSGEAGWSLEVVT